MAVTEADTLAAASILNAMAEFKQIAGLIVGITTGLQERAVASEILRMVEDTMDSRGYLAAYRQYRDEAQAGLDDLRAAIDD